MVLMEGGYVRGRSDDKNRGHRVTNYSSYWMILVALSIANLYKCLTMSITSPPFLFSSPWSCQDLFSMTLRPGMIKVRSRTGLYTTPTSPSNEMTLRRSIKSN